MGDEVLGYYRWVPEIKSCLVSKIDYTEAYAPINKILGTLFLILLAGAALMGVLGYFVALSIVGPIKKLHNSVKIFRDGDFSVRSDVATNDEVGEMSQTFNEMAGKLKTSYTDLESKVVEKTKALEDKVQELEKMNSLMVGRELTMIDLKNKLKEKK